MRGVPMITAMFHDATGDAGCHERLTINTIAAAAASAGPMNRRPIYALTAGASSALVGSGISESRSVDGGATWVTVDSYQLVSTYLAVPNAIAEDAAGNLYVAGWASDASSAQHWIVRKKAAGGSAWTTVDNYQYVPGQQLRATAIAVDNASGSIYVTGAGNDSGARSHAILRKASTTAGAGNGFVIVNDFQRDAGRSTSSSSLLLGPSGELIQAVNASVLTGDGWIIRTSFDGGATFSILDQYQSPAGTTKIPSGLAKFGAFVFAVGTVNDALTATPTTGQYLITRKY